MPLTRRRSLVLVCVFWLPLAAPVSAQDRSMSLVHVRPESQDLRELVDAAALGSTAIRDLIAQLDRSNVIVYIRARTFPSQELQGQIGLLSATGGYRYLMIELACVRPTLAQIATLGHELHHAVEIARETSIVDARTLAAYYERIGFRVSSMSGVRMFETEAARHTGDQVRRELATKPARSTNGS